MYGATDALPAVYTERLRTQIYDERITYPGAWNKLVVIGREDDDETTLNHALIQSRRRNRTYAQGSAGIEPSKRRAVDLQVSPRSTLAERHRPPI